MLGVRHFRGCAIDLWCGEPRDFVSDVTVSDVTACNQYPHKHICITPATTCNPHDLFADISHLLDSNEPHPRRITVILRDVPTYKVFQSALFATFPELDDE